MARIARKLSNSGIYHIMVRGVNKNLIFECEGDYRKFLTILAECKKLDNFELYAYCLMNNHVHLLIKETSKSISEIMRRILTRYAQWFNLKYQRTGHLFQNRFKSEPVETDGYFMTVIRYIHQNPLKAKLCDNISDYPYSSYNDYLSLSPFIDSGYVYELLPNSEFTEFHNHTENVDCIEMQEDNALVRYTDDKSFEIFTAVTGCESVGDFSELSKSQSERYITELHQLGLSIRQINKFTGVGSGVIRRLI